MNYKRYSKFEAGFNKHDNIRGTYNNIHDTPFVFIQETNNKSNNMGNRIIRDIHIENEVNKLFFSKENIKRIQRLIRSEINERTNGEFKLTVDQDEKELSIVMRGIYLQYAKNLPYRITSQVKTLNKYVINDTVPKMITEIKQYYGYLKEINKPIEPIMRPMNTSNAGRLILPSTSKIWGI